MHVGTPTLNVNAPPFPPNPHQAPLPPYANRPNNFYTNVPNANTPSHTFNTHVPPPFNPHVPPPYFPQYPATTSPSVHSSDSSILLQKQWERQEKLDMERNQMEKEKKERKRMKEEHKQRKEDQK